MRITSSIIQRSALPNLSLDMRRVAIEQFKRNVASARRVRAIVRVRSRAWARVNAEEATLREDRSDE